MKKHWRIIVALLFIFFLILMAIHFIMSFMPPDKDDMQDIFDRHKEDIFVVSSYLKDSDFEYVVIDKKSVEDGKMFTGAYTRYVDIADEKAVKSIRRLINSFDFVSIAKSGVTIYFEKWNWSEEERGIAYNTIDTSRLETDIEFLIQQEPLSENGWFYIVSDYNEWRNKR